MKASLWLLPGGRHTLRFDEIEVSEIARLMQGVSFHLPVQVCDHRRNILGIWQAGELRDAAAELARLNL
jgi:hypothetical protein